MSHETGGRGARGRRLRPAIARKDPGWQGTADVTLQGPGGRKGHKAPSPKALPEPPKQEWGGDATSPSYPQHGREPPASLLGRKAFTETPGHSFPPRDAISSDTLAAQGLAAQVSRSPALPAPLPAAVLAGGPRSPAASAQELAAVTSLGTPCRGTRHPGCAGQAGTTPCQGAGAAGSDAERPAQLPHGAEGLTCTMAPHLLPGHKFSMEQGNSGGFQIPLHCLPLRTTLGCVRRKTILDLPESQLGCATGLSPKRDFGSSRRGDPVSSSKGDPAWLRSVTAGRQRRPGGCTGCVRGLQALASP